ncbi:MAG: CRISPR-associated helicase Cas3' [Veillonellaceae bacterium]|nr:CRISPR-associated helicase Cas3' [Veillonellaceae bacterium]
MADFESSQPLLELWGKYDHQNQKLHPLLYHLTETAAVCRAFLERRPSLTVRFSESLRVAEKEVLEWIPFLAYTHDIGKASPWFAYSPHGPWVKETKPAFPRLAAFYGNEKVPHGVVSSLYLQYFFPDLNAQGLLPEIDSKIQKRLARAIGGHHGQFVSQGTINKARKGFSESDAVTSPWWAIAKDLLKSGLRWIKPSCPITTAPCFNQVSVLLAGLVCLSDWIASNSEFFPYETGKSSDCAISDLWEQACSKSAKALDQAGFRSQKRKSPSSFIGLFAKTPRKLQEHVDALLPETPIEDPPQLLILEAPMGEGKTEAALLALDRWDSNKGRCGAYIAMPTMATSNQMFRRVKDFLEKRSPGGKQSLHLLHGQALLSDEYDQLKARAIAQDEGDIPSVLADEWFCGPKRGLLSPNGVGTVDQTLLSVLQTRHYFLRLFALAEKTLIFDEVHAYDTYMLILYLDLLRWLASLGTTVVVLSATLPLSTRKSMTKAFAEGLGKQLEDFSALEKPYPRVTSISGSGHLSCDSFPAYRNFSCDLEWEQNPQEIAEALKEEMETQGGSVAWLCNTVASARETFGLLSKTFEGTGIELLLFHSRFQAGKRKNIEEQVLERFGRNRQEKFPGDKVVLVATQVVEQSLDLDFDHMISELAPVDLLLQRMGRVHRHDNQRPKAYPHPRLRILLPSEDMESFGPSGYVYEPYLLLRTWLSIRDRNLITLPHDMDDLIEAVYGEGITFTGDLEKRLEELRRRMEERKSLDQFKALKILVKKPGAGDITEAFLEDLQEEGDFTDSPIVAQTRLGPARVSVVLLHKMESGLYLDAKGREPISLEPPVNVTVRRSWERQMVEASVELSYHGCFADFPEPEKAWRSSPLLKRHRLALLEKSRKNLGEGRVLELDEKLGVIVRFPNKEGGASVESDV